MSDDSGGRRDHDEKVEKDREERRRRAPMTEPPQELQETPQAAQSLPKGKRSGWMAKTLNRPLRSAARGGLASLGDNPARIACGAVTNCP